MIHVQIPTKQFKKEIQKLIEREIPFATALTLTTLAKHVKNDLTGAIPKVFDNPTRFTRNSIYMKSARKNDLKAEVGIKNQGSRGTPAARYLAAQVHGGSRKQKPSERILTRKGLLNSRGIWTPGHGIRRNQHGNITQAQVRKIIAAVGSHNDKIFYADMNGKPGIFQRGSRGTMSRLLFFSKEPTLPRYKVRFPFYTIAQKTVDRRFQESASEAISKVIATRR